MIPLDAKGLLRYQRLQAEAVEAVAARFEETLGRADERLAAYAREALRDDLVFHLEFLRAALEFGLLQPMVDYLRWLGSVLVARHVPVDHLAQTLDWIAEFFERAMAPAEGPAVVSTIRAARAESLASRDAPPHAPTPPKAWPQAAVFEAALLDGRSREALAVVNRCLDEGRGLVDVELHVVVPALYDIGERWRANRVSVAQEHMATAIAQSVMTAALLRSAPHAPVDRRVLLACVEGNLHALGLRMVADAFVLGGWEVRQLGADVPAKTLVEQAAQWKPDLVGLSVSFPHHLHGVRVVIATLTERLGVDRPAVIVGGLAVNRLERLADVLGADASSPDARAAVERADRIVGPRQGS